MLLTMSQILLYNMTITRCLCVEHLARLALELNKPPMENRSPFQTFLTRLSLSLVLFRFIGKGFTDTQKFKTKKCIMESYENYQATC